MQQDEKRKTSMLIKPEKSDNREKEKGVAK
jgi:hypothetical protein